MPLVPFEPQEGIVRTDSPYSQMGRWVNSDKVRFVRGRAQKIGGWAELRDDDAVFDVKGIPRGIHSWNDNESARYVAFGTEFRLFVMSGLNTLWDITPYRVIDVALGNNPFTTDHNNVPPYNSTNTPPNWVLVAHTDHGWTGIGNRATFSGATPVGGLDMNGTWEVVYIVDANSYYVAHDDDATSSATGGGAAVLASYDINPGAASTSFQSGWGTSFWSRDGWSEPATANLNTLQLRVWALNNYGENLTASYNDSVIYTWDPDTGNNRATAIPNAPLCRSHIVTEERFIMALGAVPEAGGIQDLLNIRWCDQNDMTDWVTDPTGLNTAGEQRLTIGSTVVGARVFGGNITLVWTDRACHRFQYSGDEFVFNVSLAGDYCGLVSPLAAVTHGGTAFWMGPDTFWVFDGAQVRQIPNSEVIRDFVYDEFLDPQAYKCNVGVNGQFNEIWFVYPDSQDPTSEPARYAAISLTAGENDQGFEWVVGTLNRTCWTRLIMGKEYPLSASSDGRIWQHEVGYDDGDLPMEAYIVSAPYELQSGNKVLDVLRFVPDFESQIGDMEVTLTGHDYPRSTVVETTDLLVETDSSVVDCRLGARQVSVTFYSNELGGYFRLGKPRFDIEATAERR